MRSYSVILIDGTGFLFRAFHALPPLTNSAGEPTGAIYGLLNMLGKLEKAHSDSQMIVVFDAPGPTFRDEIFADYKATRKRTPDDLKVQITPAQSILKAQGLPVLIESGVEADDVIGTLAVQADQAGRSILICTSDKDMAQLVNDRIHLFDSMKNKLLDAEAVQQKFGVAPELIIDYLALAGDSSDNIPGVPGVGPKTAVRWLAEYGSLAGVLENQAAIGGKIGEKLRASNSQAELSKTLATIKCDVALPLNLDKLPPKTPDLTALKSWYERLEYKYGLMQIAMAENDGQLPSVAETPAANYETITTAESFSNWINKLTKTSPIGYEMLSSGGRVQADLIGIAFSSKQNTGCYIPLKHNHESNLPLADAIKGLKQLFESTELIMVGQHIKHSLHLLAQHGLDYKARFWDISLSSYVLNSLGRHDLVSLARQWLKQTVAPLGEVLGKGAAKKPLADLSLAEATHYAAKQADFILQIYALLKVELEKTPKLQALFTEMEMPLAFVLAKMERRGVKIDPALLQAQSKKIKKRIAKLEEKVYAAAGHTFNLNSTQQLQKVLYEELELPILRKTPKGAPSTAEPVLAELALEYELPQTIIDYRGLVKLKTTYLDKLPEDAHAETGRVHTSFHQSVTSTGRLSSSDPNLQNIPIRTEDGRHIRQAFIAPAGKKLIAADYSQIELRIMAHISGDAGLLEAFRNNQDIHRTTAAEVLGLATTEVTEEQRREAKAVNFGLIYGMSAFGLSRQLGISRWAAQDYIDLYFERYPSVKNYMDAVLVQAQEAGYVETVFGRRLYLPDIKAANGRLRQVAERAAINAPMQGTAADIIKRAMVNLDSQLATSELKSARMLLQVHDELVFEVDSQEASLLAEKLRITMSEAASLAVPLTVNIKSGDNWLEAH